MDRIARIGQRVVVGVVLLMLLCAGALALLSTAGCALGVAGARVSLATPLSKPNFSYDSVGVAQKNDRAEGNVFAAAPAFANFERDLLDDVIPAIESRYSVQKDRNDRALAGLSMGANQTIQITMNNLEKFSHIGGFSGTSNYPSTAPLDPETFSNGRFKDGEALNKQIKLFWLGLGTKEPNPFPGSVGAFKAMLDRWAAEPPLTDDELPPRRVDFPPSSLERRRRR